MSAITNPHDVRVGDVFRINDSHRLLIVTAVDAGRADVVDQDARHPRSIALSALRTSKAKHGYTLVERGRS